MNLSELPTQLESASSAADERSTQSSRPGLNPERTLFLSALLLTSSFMTLVLVSLPQIVAQFIIQTQPSPTSQPISLPPVASQAVAPQPHAVLLPPHSTLDIKIAQQPHNRQADDNVKQVAITVTPFSPGTVTTGNQPISANASSAAILHPVVQPASIQVILHP